MAGELHKFWVWMEDEMPYLVEGKDEDSAINSYIETELGYDLGDEAVDKVHIVSDDLVRHLKKIVNWEPV